MINQSKGSTIGTEEAPYGILEGKANMTTVTNLMGLSRQNEKAEEQIRKGLPYEALERIIQATGFSLKDIATSLGIPQRMLMNHKRKGYLFMTECDKLYRFAFAFVFDQAEKATGSAKEAYDWLMEKAPALGGVAPITLPASDKGAQRVKGLIRRIMCEMKWTYIGSVV